MRSVNQMFVKSFMFTELNLTLTMIDNNFTLLLDVMMVQDAAAKDKSQLPWDFLIGKLGEESYDEDQTLL